MESPNNNTRQANRAFVIEGKMFYARLYNPYSVSSHKRTIKSELVDSGENGGIADDDVHIME